MQIKTTETTVVVAKSDRILCDFICEFIKEKGLHLVGQAHKGADAFKLLIEKSPDIVILGSELSGLQGIDLVAFIHDNNMATKSILFSRDKSEAMLMKAENCGVSGILFFDDSLQEFSACIHSVLNGKTYRSSQFEKMSFQMTRLENCHKDGREFLNQNLTYSELKVLWLVSQHLTMKQIGQKLFISYNTVTNHQSNIRKKLNINGHGSLLKYALSLRERFVEANGQVWLRPK
jgi:DNA-binding NarL/FixJ family response regulator